MPFERAGFTRMHSIARTPGLCLVFLAGRLTEDLTWRSLLEGAFKRPRTRDAYALQPCPLALPRSSYVSHHLARGVEAEPLPSTIQHDCISPDSASLVFLVGRYLRTSVQALSAVTPTQSRLRSSRYHSQFTESHARDARGLFRLRAVTCTRGAALVTLGGKRSQCPHLPRELLGAAADG